MESKSFTDFDAFAASVRDVDAGMMFQNPKTRSWSIKHAYLPVVHVQLGRLGSGNIVEGQSWSNGYLLYLPLTDACEYSGNGIVVEKGSFLILEPGCDFCVATKSEHDWCTMLIPSDRFAGGDEERSPRKMTCRVSPQNFRAASKFRMLVEQIMATAAKHPKFESSPAAVRVEEELLKVAIEMLGEQEAHDPGGRPRVPRREVFRRCQEFLEGHEGEHIRVDDLVATSGVSARSLRRAFNERYGVSADGYLQLRQLHRVHRVLKSAEHDATNVSDVLFTNGVYDLGHFAARYRRLFGELPSETLRR